MQGIFTLGYIKNGVIFVRTVVFLIIYVCLTSATHAKPYTVGVVPQFEQRKLFSIWAPILNALAQRTGYTFQLIGSEGISDFETAFLEGKYDLAYMNPYHFVMAQKAQGYVPLARSGAKKLFGILVIHKDSPLVDVRELTGKSVAFPSPNALGASLLMRAELAKKQKLVIDPTYVKTHSSVYLHVAKGLMPAGGGVMRTLQKQPQAIKDKLKILYQTTQVKAHPLVAHPRIKPDVQTKIRNAWLALSTKNPALFAKIPMTMPVKATVQDYENLAHMGLEDFVVR